MESSSAKRASAVSRGTISEAWRFALALLVGSAAPAGAQVDIGGNLTSTQILDNLPNPSSTNVATVNLGSSVIVSSGNAIHGQNKAWTLTNSGTLTSTGGVGVQLQAGGSVDNRADGSITGTSQGVFFVNAAGTLTNAGSITATSGMGVQLQNGTTADNTGTISATQQGIYFVNAAGTLTNSGSIISSATSACNCRTAARRQIPARSPDKATASISSTAPPA
jgi:hypothetical protein